MVLAEVNLVHRFKLYIEIFTKESIIITKKFYINFLYKIFTLYQHSILAFINEIKIK